MSNPFVIPGISPELQEVIDTHRALFGGFTMMADEPEKGEKADDEAGEKSDEFKSPESKQAVLSDLAKERQARQALQQQVDDLKPVKEWHDRFQQAFGAQPGDGKDDGDAIAAINRRLDEADTRAEVERLARTHRITDDNDVALLQSIGDKAQREALAKRLAPSEDDAADGKKPKPDPTAGRSGGSGARTSTVEAGRSLYQDMHKTSNN